VWFGDGNQASLSEARSGDVADIIAGMGLTPTAKGCPVVVVCGGADDLTDGALDRAGAIIGAAVASAAKVTGAVLVDGGTFKHLVTGCEAALATEQSGWVQQMNDALRDLRRDQAEAAGRVDHAENAKPEQHARNAEHHAPGRHAGNENPAPDQHAGGESDSPS